MIPGRWKDVRGPTEQELQQTTVLSLSLNEASAKIRTGPPLDDEQDYELPIWAGVIPLEMTVGTTVNDPRLDTGRTVPEYVRSYSRKRN